MNLFIDTISNPCKILIFDINKKIIDDFTWIGKMNESSTLIPSIDSLLLKNHIKYDDLENIVIVNGPGSFTGVRVSVLVANTINFIIKKNMTAVSFFELYEMNNFAYPIIKASSKRDLFVKKGFGKKIEIISNEDFLNYLKINNISEIYGEKIPYFDLNISNIPNYKKIIKKLQFDNQKELSPLYIKKPNIT